MPDASTPGSTFCATCVKCAPGSPVGVVPGAYCDSTPFRSSSKPIRTSWNSVVIAHRSRDHPVNQQQHHRTDDRHEEPGWMALRIPAQGAADEATEPTAHEADERRDDQSARVMSGKKKLGNDADQQAEERVSNHAEHAP